MLPLWYLNLASRLRPVAAASRDILALLRRRAHAATATTEGGTAAFGLALVVLKDKQGVVARSELGTHQRCIRCRIAPRTHVIPRIQLHIIKRANRLVPSLRSTRLGQEVIRETLPPRR